MDILRLELCVTKRTARRIVKRLRRLGLASVLRERDSLVVEVINPAEALERLVLEYSARRRSRCKLPPPGSPDGGACGEGCTRRG